MVLPLEQLLMSSSFVYFKRNLNRTQLVETGPDRMESESRPRPWQHTWASIGVIWWIIVDIIHSLISYMYFQDDKLLLLDNLLFNRYRKILPTHLLEIVYSLTHTAHPNSIRVICGQSLVKLFHLNWTALGKSFKEKVFIKFRKTRFLCFISQFKTFSGDLNLCVSCF